MRRSHQISDDRGAAAVEFAIVAMLLITLVLGAVEFGRAYNAQISLSAAAREGARTMAVHNDAGLARERTKAAAPALSPALADSQIAISPSPCSSGNEVTVTVGYPLPLLTGLFGDGITLSGKGVMRCGG